MPRTLMIWLVRLVLLAFMLLVAAAITVVIVLPRASNGAALTVLTGSMTPTISVGSVVIVRPVDPQTLEVGDIATYQVKPGQDVYITHRIIKIQQSDSGLSFIFKGDANRGRDLTPVSPKQIRGEVWFHVPYLGGIRDALHGKGGISLVATILLAGYALTQISGGLRDRRKGPAEEASGPGQLWIDRPLVVARFKDSPDTTSLDLARAWGGLVLEADGASFTLLIAPPTDGLAATLELLQAHDALDIRVWDPPTTLAGTSVTIRDAATAEEASHVVG
jgi:signal peptidase